MSLTPFEISLTVIAAIILALEQGFVDAPILSRHLPAFFTSPRWRYVPAALMVVAFIAFGFRQLYPPKPIEANQPQKVTVVYVPKNIYVPTPDPAQAARIGDLERQLRAARISPVKPTTSQAPTTQPPVNVPAPQQTNKPPEELTCHEKLDLFKSFVSLASISQIAIGSSRDDTITDDAASYGQWVARVEAFLDKAKPEDFDKTDFETAHGTDSMKPPSRLNRDQAAIWKEYEAKKNALQKEVYGLANVRCD